MSTTLVFAMHPGINGLSNNRNGQKIDKLIAKIENVALSENFSVRATSRLGEATLFCLIGNDDVTRFLERLKNSLFISGEFASVTFTAVTGHTAEPTLTANECLSSR
ncbi:MAG: hypothetical protein WC819_04620 [Parcubacteria group bacterium]|jgi:hypothetical protein